MESKEYIIPKNLISKIYPHPEEYGDNYFIVDLINGMFTDVFLTEDGDYITITNDEKLIRFLKSNI